MSSSNRKKPALKLNEFKPQTSTVSRNQPSNTAALTASLKTIEDEANQKAIIAAMEQDIDDRELRTRGYESKTAESASMRSTSSVSSITSVSSSTSMSGDSAPNNQAMEDEKHEIVLKDSLDVPEIFNIIMEYVGPVGLDSTNFNPATHYSTPGRQLTFFELQLPAFTLVQHAASAEKGKVENMLNKALALSKNKHDPELLRALLESPATVTDHAGRTHYQRTVYQVALGANYRDVVIEKDGKKIQVVDGLVEMIEGFFLKLSNGAQLMQQQYEAQFPKGYEEEVEKPRRTNDSFALNQVMQAVVAATDADCQQTMLLDSFHGYDLRPLKNVSNDNEILPGAIYLEDQRMGLGYKVRGFDGNVKQATIPRDELPKLLPGSNDKFPRSTNEIIKLKYRCLPILLDKVAAAHHTYTFEQMIALKQMSTRIEKAATDETFNAAFAQLKREISHIVLILHQQPININFEVLEAIYHFRNYVEPKGYYTIGFHSNPQLQLEAYQLYDDNYVEFGNAWSAPKNVLSWQKVVNLPQRRLPGCDAHLVAQGLYGVLYEGNKSLASFNFTYGGGSIFPIDSDPVFRLGYNYGAARWRLRVGFASAWRGAWAAAGSRVPRAAWFGRLISSKNHRGPQKSMRPRRDNWTKNGCGIM